MKYQNSKGKHTNLETLIYFIPTIPSVPSLILFVFLMRMRFLNRILKGWSEEPQKHLYKNDQELHMV